MEGFNNGMPNINGIMYDWSCVKVAIAGVTLIGITAVDYGDKQDIQKAYGAGRLPIGYGKGRIDCSGKITLYQEEVEALQAASPTARLQDLPMFDVNVSYLPENGKVVHHILKGVKFPNNERKNKEGSTKNEVELDLMIMSIDWGKKK